MALELQLIKHHAGILIPATPETSDILLSKIRLGDVLVAEFKRVRNPSTNQYQRSGCEGRRWGSARHLTFLRLASSLCSTSSRPTSPDSGPGKLGWVVAASAKGCGNTLKSTRVISRQPILRFVTSFGRVWDGHGDCERLAIRRAARYRHDSGIADTRPDRPCRQPRRCHRCAS